MLHLKKFWSKCNKKGNKILEDGRVFGNGFGCNFGEVGGEGREGVGKGIDLDIDPYHPTNTIHVDNVNMEEQFNRYEDGPSRWLMLDGWLQQCARDSPWNWGPNLPGMNVDDGKVVPAATRSYNDLALIEVIDKNEGFIGQFQTSRASVLKLQNTQSKLIFWTNKNQEHNRRHMRVEPHRIQEEFDRTKEIHITESMAMPLETEELKKHTSGLTTHLDSLNALVKNDVEHFNKVKKLVALTLARNAMESALGIVKGTTETWFAYFNRVTVDDWHRVGVESGLVKSLLADEVHAFNDSIYENLAQEVIGSITSMPLGSVRNAWEEIFKLAFQRKITDKLFCEDIDYATQ